MSSHEATVKPTDHVESGSTLNINAGAGMQRNYALNGGSNVRQFNSDVLNYTMNNVYPGKHYISAKRLELFLISFSRHRWGIASQPASSSNTSVLRLVKQTR